jgi:hypothetical protein
MTMGLLRGAVLAALVLASASILIGSPAFATPNLTASSGTRAVSPFITPSTNTTSLYTAASTDSQLVLPALGSTVSCRTASVSAYASTTHTQLRLVSVIFGNGSDCSVSPAGTVEEQPINCTATSANPWLLHIRSLPGGTSAAGTPNVTSSCRIIELHLGTRTPVTIDANQLCRTNAGAGNNEYTWDVRTGRGSLVVNCTVTVTIVGAIRTSTTSTFTGTYTVRPDTRRDTNLVVTARS